MTNLLNTFNQLCYSNDPAMVFSDLLTVVIAQFCPPSYYESEHAAAVSRLKNKELINQFVFELISEYQSGIDKCGWCDPWGNLYMEIIGKYKAKAMGQFFTPDHVCILMSQLTEEDQNISGKLISNPTCGSGRNLLAFKAKHPDNYFFGEDIDPICCKMAVSNFAFHGCIGEVIEHNTLSVKNFVQGWRIMNIGLPVPAVMPITKEQSFIVSGVIWFDQEREKINKLQNSLNAIDMLSNHSAELPNQISQKPNFDKEIKVEQLELKLL